MTNTSTQRQWRRQGRQKGGLKHLSWIGKIVKIYEMLLKKSHFS